ncbi:hypothetical protein SMSK564_1665 [Streptococcus mitis SK564]|uniref:Uncharacterized protein n=1 Tax=Streptococcus mitis SK564 TaxID=585203 RepID=E1LP86_STRMT|nr:hypothetical protein SMSK564_1665 [Streptococcus mitis SK564]
MDKLTLLLYNGFITKNAPCHILHSISLLKMDRNHCKGYQKEV